MRGDAGIRATALLADPPPKILVPVGPMQVQDRDDRIVKPRQGTVTQLRDPAIVDHRSTSPSRPVSHYIEVPGVRPECAQQAP